MTYLEIAREFFGAIYQPKVKPILHRAQIAGQFRMVALGIVHQVSGMDLEEPRQQHARRVCELRPRSALDLRQVRLAESSAHLLLERPRQILLGHLAAEAAQRAFHQAQIAEFFAELHWTASYYDLQLPYCNLLCKRIEQGGGAR